MPLVQIPKSFVGEACEHDPQQDRQRLQELLPDCQNFSPLVGIDSTDPTRCNHDSIFLDISRTASVLGGVRQVLHDIHQHFQQQELQPQVQVGETLGQAWALAHQPQTNDAVTPPTLTELPVASLQIKASTIEILSELGIDTLGKLWQLPRASLPSRFGDLINRRMEQFLGQQEELILVHHPEIELQWKHSLEHASGDLDILQTILCLLLRQAINVLKPRQQGILSLRCQFLSAGKAMDYCLKLVQPTLDLDYLLQLLQLQMEQQEIQTPQEQVRLTIDLVGEHRPQQQWLFPDPEQTSRKQRAALVERLTARLGTAAVQQLRQQSQALPERQWVPRKQIRFSQTGQNKSRRTRNPSSPLSESNETLGQHQPGSLERPTRLFAVPKPLRQQGTERFHLQQGSEYGRHINPRSRGAWVPLQFIFHKQRHQVVHAVGPERIESHWWEGQWVRRDYFRVQTDQGQRFWIFRQAQNHQWYLHGDFA